MKKNRWKYILNIKPIFYLFLSIWLAVLFQSHLFILNQRWYFWKSHIKNSKTVYRNNSASYIDTGVEWSNKKKHFTLIPFFVLTVICFYSSECFTRTLYSCSIWLGDDVTYNKKTLSSAHYDSYFALKHHKNDSEHDNWCVCFKRDLS